ncbi:MAG TPA: succinyl-diaminopimelate desuccinylase [Acidimicrobiales bacterium]|nr:succinyl-diaminopimelate desuccinylase [Acidimicrobiales bacterium]
MTDLVGLAARYVAIPSVSGEEAALADEIERALREVRDLEVVRLGDNVVARTTGDRTRRVLVAGHLDTVPGEQGVTVADDAVTGLGACDMKGSVAVMVALATSGLAFASELTWIFYAREEIARTDSGLLELAATKPSLLDGDVAIVCEPTGTVVEAGCQGVVRLRLVLRGERAHTARPWRGRNAIHRLAGPLAAVAAYTPRAVELDGVEYTEQLQAVDVTGGVSGNVVPDLATLTVNQRVAPDRSARDAVHELRGTFAPFLEEGDALEELDVVDPAPPRLDDPTLARLVELSGAPPRAKLGFTDVATFSARGLPAANFGAGDPELAHHRGEFVRGDDLARCHDVLAALLTEDPRA